jgi:hypothetical protein
MKTYLTIAAIVLMAFANLASAASWPWSDEEETRRSSNGAPAFNGPSKMSFGFVQETGWTLKKGEIRADIYNTTEYPWHIRVGAFGGEVLIDPSDAPDATGLGYKRSFKNFALYGKLFLSSDNGNQGDSWAIGVSHSARKGKLTYNANGHYTNANAANEETLLVNGSVFYRVIVKAVPGPVQLGAEVTMQVSPGPTRTDLFGGIRWEPRRNVLLDLGLATSVDGDTFIGTPAFVRLNLGF